MKLSPLCHGVSPTPHSPSPIWLDAGTKCRLSWWQDGTWAASCVFSDAQGVCLVISCAQVSWVGGHSGMAGPAWFGASNCYLPLRNLGPATASRHEVPSLWPFTLTSRLLCFNLPRTPRISIFFALYIWWCEIPPSTIPTLLAWHHVEMGCKMLAFSKQFAFLKRYTFEK